jgi:hypothetical protein
MSSNKSGEELAVLQSKVAQLEAKQKIQCMGQKMKELMKALEKRIQEIEKKEMETKFEKIQAALENERRDKLFERRDRSLEDERRERQAEKKEMMAVLALEKKEMMAALENERRDREAALENEKRDRLLEDERRERQAEKKEMMAALENERRDREAASENEKRDRLLEDERRERQAEKKEMMAALEKTEREHQHQIDQLKSEARISQMEQQLLEVRAYTSQGISISQPTIQHTAMVDLAPQRDTELLLLRRSQQMEKERELKLLKATAPTAVQPMTIPNKVITSPLQAPDTSYKMALQPVPPKAAAVSQASKSIDISQQPSQISSHKPDTTTKAAFQPSLQSAPHTSAVTPATTTSANAGTIPLPGDSHTHFFLSHCQGTGGDQTNAICLELQKLGFTCWYDNRATDLTKEGMRKGIVHAAAFLLFLSKGVLERPFCELFFLHCLCTNVYTLCQFNINVYTL